MRAKGTTSDIASEASEHPPFHWKIFLLAVTFAVACAVPFVLDDYRVFQLTLTLIYAIAILGLNLVMGYNGQISLGHGAFYAIGAYTAAILMTYANVPNWATLPLSGLLCLIVGFLFGLPALRLQGLYLALATFALAVATPQILKSRHLEAWTGGAQGIVLLKPAPPADLPISPDQWLYLFTLLIALGLFIIAWNLVRGRIGRAIKAIRDNPIAAEAMGVNVPLYKSVTFGISASYTGIAGSLGAIVVQFISPDSFSMFLSISFLVGVVVGGLASVSGALFGAAFIVFTPNMAGQLSKAMPWAIYGVFLVVFMRLMPTGIVGFLHDAAPRLPRKNGK